MSPAAPAAGIACPIIDFTEPMPMSAPVPPPGPNTSVSEASSVASPATVAVPWASTSPSTPGSRGSSPAAAHAACIAATWPEDCGAIRLAARPSLATPVPRITA